MYTAVSAAYCRTMVEMGCVSSRLIKSFSVPSFPFHDAHPREAHAAARLPAPLARQRPTRRGTHTHKRMPLAQLPTHRRSALGGP